MVSKEFLTTEFDELRQTIFNRKDEFNAEVEELMTLVEDCVVDISEMLDKGELTIEEARNRVTDNGKHLVTTLASLACIEVSVAQSAIRRTMMTIIVKMVVSSI